MRERALQPPPRMHDDRLPPPRQDQDARALQDRLSREMAPRQRPYGLFPAAAIDFPAALAALKAGRAVTRTRWRGLPGAPAHLTMRRDGSAIIAYWRGPPARARQWQSWDDDLLATDWRVLAPSEML